MATQVDSFRIPAICAFFCLIAASCGGQQRNSLSAYNVAAVGGEIPKPDRFRAIISSPSEEYDKVWGIWLNSGGVLFSESPYRALTDSDLESTLAPFKGSKRIGVEFWVNLDRSPSILDFQKAASRVFRAAEKSLDSNDSLCIWTVFVRTQVPAK